MKISITKENKENKKGTKAVKIILCILFMLGVMFTIFTQWSNFTYGPVSGDQMLINLTSPTDGTDSGIYISALTKALLPSVIITILFVLFVFLRFKIILTQGLNRQIRRMCEYLGNEVVELERYRLMNINLDLPVGKWRHLTDNELNGIFKMVRYSSKTGRK